MVRLILFGILAYVIYRIVKWMLSPDTKIHSGRTQRVVDEMVQDPFCKTYIPRRDAVRRVIQGQEYSFCSDDCAKKFELGKKGKEGT